MLSTKFLNYAIAKNVDVMHKNEGQIRNQHPKFTQKKVTKLNQQNPCIPVLSIGFF